MNYMAMVYNTLGGYSKQEFFNGYTKKEVKAILKKRYPAPLWKIDWIVRG